MMASVLAELARSVDCFCAARMALFNRGNSRSIRAAICAPDGTLTGNSTCAGSTASLNVVGLEVKLWSMVCLPTIPKKWNVYFPGTVGMNQAR